GHLQGPQARVLVADIGVANLGRRAVHAVLDRGPHGGVAGEDLDQVDHDQVAVGVDLADIGVIAAVGQGGHALARGAAGRVGRLLLTGAGALLPLAGGGGAAGRRGRGRLGRLVGGGLGGRGGGGGAPGAPGRGPSCRGPEAVARLAGVGAGGLVAWSAAGWAAAAAGWSLRPPRARA